MNKYITKEEYLVEKGVNLEIELHINDNESDKVRRFISEVTNWCIEYLVSNYDCNELLGLFANLPEWRQKWFRAGVIEQCEYILDEGWINKASGVNMEVNTILDLARVRLSPTAYLKFKFGAFCNIVRY